MIVILAKSCLDLSNGPIEDIYLRLSSSLTEVKEAPKPAQKSKIVTASGGTVGGTIGRGKNERRLVIDLRLESF